MVAEKVAGVAAAPVDIYHTYTTHFPSIVPFLSASFGKPHRFQTRLLPQFREVTLHQREEVQLIRREKLIVAKLYINVGLI